MPNYRIEVLAAPIADISPKVLWDRDIAAPDLSAALAQAKQAAMTQKDAAGYRVLDPMSDRPLHLVPLEIAPDA